MISGVGIDFSPRPPEHHDPGRHDVGSDEWHAVVRTASSPASPTLRLARWLAGLPLPQRNSARHPEPMTVRVPALEAQPLAHDHLRVLETDLQEDPEDLKRRKLRHHRGPQTPN